MHIQIGNKVQWERRRRTSGGFEIVLREGTVLALEGEVAVIKPPNKYAKRQRVHVSRLMVKNSDRAVAGAKA